VVSSGRHLLTLINDVLDLAKVESGSMTFHPEPASLRQIVSSTIDEVRILVQQKGIELSTEFEAPQDEVFLDPHRLRQVILNYVSNGLKFTPAGGRIVICIRTESAACFRLEVRDSGPGIAPDELQKLFREFQQLDDSRSRSAQGTGLGLALTKRLVEAQSGSVGVDSVQGVGSTFHAILPYGTISAEKRRLAQLTVG